MAHRGAVTSCYIHAKRPHFFAFRCMERYGTKSNIMELWNQVVRCHITLLPMICPDVPRPFAGERAVGQREGWNMLEPTPLSQPIVYDGFRRFLFHQRVFLEMYWLACRLTCLVVRGWTHLFDRLQHGHDQEIPDRTPCHGATIPLWRKLTTRVPFNSRFCRVLSVSCFILTFLPTSPAPSRSLSLSLPRFCEDLLPSTCTPRHLGCAALVCVCVCVVDLRFLANILGKEDQEAPCFHRLISELLSQR